MEVETWPLAHRPESVGIARQIARSLLECWEMDSDQADAVLLVVSELVTNSIEHAEPPVTLHLYRERIGWRVWVGITDGGPTHQGARTMGQDDEHGRGLVIVRALATAHGSRAHAKGTTHWAHLPIRTKSRPA
ncbi:ATP-binding protein [Streptomyces sp. NPDC056661]|uniref:ATP-binding protein n=1 Tax=Streptomyces sp. NPDC056661 TaxID=3345898 RepID=UPI0036CB95F9